LDRKTESCVPALGMNAPRFSRFFRASQL